MIKDNIIYFGYGDIATSNTFDGYLTLRQFKPPVKVGANVKKDAIFLSDLIKIKVSHKDLKQISNMNEVSGKQYAIGEYVLDFSNYNPKSVNVVVEHILMALGISRMALAC